MSRVEKVEKFLRRCFQEPMQSFRSRNWIGDPMTNIYDEDGVQIDICYDYDYLEIFGLTDEEYKELKKENLIF